uniref:SOCS box domain-containing protein n=1 Tax=Macrostomum lignano TaxID=282301 RepID=A0A1I8FPX5_9PLAT
TPCRSSRWCYSAWPRLARPPCSIDLLTTLLWSRAAQHAAGDCCGRRQITPGRTGLSEVVTIALWDTAGEERFSDFNALYYKGSSGCAVVCYDLADYNTLLKSSFWISDLSMRLPDAAIFLCGCKSDLLLCRCRRQTSAPAMTSWLAMTQSAEAPIRGLRYAAQLCTRALDRLLHQKLQPKVVSEIFNWRINRAPITARDIQSPAPCQQGRRAVEELSPSFDAPACNA